MAENNVGPQGGQPQGTVMLGRPPGQFYYQGCLYVTADNYVTAKAENIWALDLDQLKNLYNLLGKYIDAQPRPSDMIVNGISGKPLI